MLDEINRFPEQLGADPEKDAIALVCERLEQLQEQVNRLTDRVTMLEGGLTAAPALEKQKNIPTKQISTPEQSDLPFLKTPKPKGPQGETILPRIAAISFILVAALLLRTITDNKIIDQGLGSLLGIFYASGLIGSGLPLYRKKSKLAPVFPYSGAILLFTIVMETHSRFESISTMPAYAILLLCEVAVVAMGISFRDVSLLFLGIVGTLFAGFSIDFPHISFIPMAFVLWSANGAAYMAAREGLSRGLRWFVLANTLLFWLFWAYKLSVPLLRGTAPSSELALNAFFPFLILFNLSYFACTVVRVCTKEEPLSFFHGILPTINILLFFLAAGTVVVPWTGSDISLGMSSLLFAGVHLLTAAYLATRNKSGAPGCNAMTFAGTLLLIISLPTLVGNIEALPALSGLALILAVLAHQWHSGGVRLTSYLAQIFVAVQLMIFFSSDPVAALWPQFAAAVGLTLFAGLHYAWSRHHRPDPTDSAFFSWLDRNDLSAVALFAAALIGAFGLIRLGLYQYVTSSHAGSLICFQCTQSMAVNIGAVILMAAGMRLKSREILRVAAVVATLGALRVFIFDLFGASGLPLVFSVFTFGITAVAGSLVHKRWRLLREQACRPAK